MVEQIKVGMSLDEFMSRFEEQPFELINGELVTVAPTKFQHSKISKRIFAHLLMYEQNTKSGEAFFETAFVLEDVSNWVAGARIPDVIFVEKSRIEQYEAQVENIDEKPLILVPDLVVEVVSPTDKYSEINVKVDTYLADGVKLIWIVDPQRKTIAAYEDSDSPKTYRVEDTLTGGAVLTNFEVAVKDIFGSA